ncbi:10125_t:CDS:2 [Paraglomus brasilianum]|uniref:Vacuolar membrane-associated protein IML1 n=1 Tax=Paraglomus brasilianum TaxID=144538 RepID=A0A9N9G351_9GLOM|nr:10125_t:CDS:2 [Paraglomus brasilianum]
MDISESAARTLKVCIHDKNDRKYSNQDVVLNPDYEFKVGRLLAVYTPEASSDRTKHLFVKFVPIDKDTLNNNQVSVTQSIASLFGFKAWSEVRVRKVDVHYAAAEHIELMFKDQYIGRGDMWRLSRSLIGSCVHVGMEVKMLGGCIKARVKKIYGHGEPLLSGLITEKTKQIFRSESAKYFILVQMSREMWEFDEDGEIYFEKTFDGFLPELFQRWKEFSTNHLVSIVLFSRVFYEGTEDIIREGVASKDDQGRWYKDHYKAIVDWETHFDWMITIESLKRELLRYQRDLLSCEKGGVSWLCGQNSCAFEGNILEAINLALNPFDKHYIDRDLLRTGLAIIIVTPGTGHFEVNKRLLRITAERMVYNGIGLDLVSLSKKPLHTVPLFKFKSQELSKAPLPRWIELTKDTRIDARDPLDYDEKSSEANHEYYKTPDWIDCSFYSRHQDKPYKPGKFVSRCKMYEIQMMGITKYDVCSVGIPYLDDELHTKTDSLKKPNGALNGVADIYELYDESVFASEKEPSAFQERGGSHPFRELTASFNQNIENRNYLVEYSRYHRVDLPSSLPKTFTATQSDHRLSKSPYMMNNQSVGSSPDIRSTLFETHQSVPMLRSGSHDVPMTSCPEEDVTFSSEAQPVPINNASRTRNRSLSHASPRANHYDPSYSDEPGKYHTKSSYGKQMAARQQHKQGLVNPSNPEKNGRKTEYGFELRKWEHIFPRPHTNTVDWTALCNPACLPLTTEDIPPINEEELYVEYTYNISVEPDVMDGETLVNEMISQRLAQGYQLIMIPPTIENPVSKTFGDTSTLLENGDGYASTFTKTDTPCFLAMGHSVHKLTRKDELSTEVKIYVKRTEYLPTPFSYCYYVWPKGQSVYEKSEVKFNYPGSGFQHPNYKWNYVDRLVSGDQNVLTDDLRFWRARFLLIPTETIPNTVKTSGHLENLSDEDIRIMGITEFLGILQKALWIPPKQQPGEAIPRLEITTLTPSEYVRKADRSIYNRALLDDTGRDLTKDSKLTTIAQAILDSNPPLLISRKWRLKFYESVIIGQEAIDWIISKFADINTRVAAEEFGNKLMEQGLLEHCNNKHPFMDGYFFYQLKGEYAPKKDFKGIFGFGLKKDNPPPVKKDDSPPAKKDDSPPAKKDDPPPAKKDDPPRSMPAKPVTSKPADTTAPQRPVSHPPLRDIKMPSATVPQVPASQDCIVLSRSIEIDIDPEKKSNRKETATLHYDVINNPDICYHFRLNWLGCTARLIESMLNTWSARHIDKYGLKLVEAPVEQSMVLTDNPFQSPTVIQLAVNPPPLDAKKLHPDVNSYLYYEIQLVKHFQFVLDVEADSLFPENVKIKNSYHKTPYKYSQYIHRSGTVFIQICEPGNGYLWVVNRLYATRGLKQAATNPDELLKKFREFCSDEKNLEQFWKDTEEAIPYVNDNKDESENETAKPYVIDDTVEGGAIEQGEQQKTQAQTLDDK